MYLNDREVTGTGHDNVRQWFQEKERAARRELEAYKATPNPEKAVIRYLKSKIEKAEKETKEWLNYRECLKEDLVEFRKTHRIPTWIVEEFKRVQERDTKKASHP
jgi:hypothetical protein